MVKDFVDAVKTDCIGHEVIKSVTPGQQLVKIVHDRMVELLGSEESELALSSNPTVIMLVGLHGSGKTTTAGKLAKYLKKQHKNVLLVAGDVYRPAAIDQLEFLGKEIDVPVYAERGNLNVPQIALHAVEEAKFNHQEVVLIDTAGRLQIDEGMVNELILLRNTVRADEILLVADAALGQEAVSVAEEPVAASKNNKGRVRKLSLFFVLLILHLNLDTASEVFNTRLLVIHDATVLTAALILIAAPLLSDILDILIVF